LYKPALQPGAKPLQRQYLTITTVQKENKIASGPKKKKKKSERKDVKREKLDCALILQDRT
jgi:hypothetical protein